MKSDKDKGYTQKDLGKDNIGMGGKTQQQPGKGGAFDQNQKPGQGGQQQQGNQWKQPLPKDKDNRGGTNR